MAPVGPARPPIWPLRVSGKSQIEGWPAEPVTRPVEPVAPEDPVIPVGPAGRTGSLAACQWMLVSRPYRGADSANIGEAVGPAMSCGSRIGLGLCSAKVFAVMTTLRDAGSVEANVTQEADGPLVNRTG